MIHSYPSIYTLGHGAVAEILNAPVLVEEKIDGSQFSMWKREDGELECRSKGAAINMIAPEGMFVLAVETVKSLADKLTPGWVYRGEYLCKPRHNMLSYERVPDHNIILFDINPGQEMYLSQAEKRVEAHRLGLECVPALFQGMIQSPSDIRAFLEMTSVLGGQKIEGVVIKPVTPIYGHDKKALLAKFVSEAFKEVHASDWKKEHGPKTSGEILIELAREYATPARFQKALIHLREEGKITDSPKDIGVLMAAVPPDIQKECEDEIKEKLWQWAWPQMRRSATKGLPEWYKDLLLSKQFEG